MACLIVTASCGNGGNAGATGSVTGNWEVTLQPHGVSGTFTFSGFLIQNGSSVTGSMILGGGCTGVGAIAGTVNGQNVTLNIDELGQDVSLIGTVSSGSAPMAGQYSTPSGACTTPYTSTGTWSAVEVTPVNGSFTGTLSSTLTDVAPVNVTGTLTQGPNTGASTATLSGTITATSSSQFCSYLTTATITGTVSGETVTLNLYGSDGALISTIPASVTADGSSLSGTYLFQPISKSCLGDGGTLKLTFKQ